MGQVDQSMVWKLCSPVKTMTMTKTGSVQTKDFHIIPYPYPRQYGNCSLTHYQCQNQPVLSSVRIPLEVFEIDLTHLVDLKITTPGAWLIAIDDIEFGY
jgi:hypothetical protein